MLELDCAVCKDQFILGTEDPDEQIVVTLPCNHPFHMPCILPWLKSSGTCPVCRYVHVLIHQVRCSYLSHRSGATHLPLSLNIIHLHVQVLDQILIVVGVRADLTPALVRVGVAGLNLEVYSNRFLAGSGITTSTITATALRLDSTEMGADRILIQCHRHRREGIDTTMVIVIVTRLELGRRTLTSIESVCIRKNSKDMY